MGCCQDGYFLALNHHMHCVCVHLYATVVTCLPGYSVTQPDPAQQNRLLPPSPASNKNKNKTSNPPPRVPAPLAAFEPQGLLVVVSEPS